MTTLVNVQPPLTTNGSRRVTLNTNSRRRNRRRANLPAGRQLLVRSNNPQYIAIQEPAVQLKGSGRTERNRRRRMRNRLLGATRVNPNSIVPMRSSPFTRYFAMAEQVTLEQSVHKLIQTQFFPTLGIHRGLSRAFESTAIAYARGSLDLTSAAAGTNLAVVLLPINAASTTDFITYQITATAFPNPFGTSGGSIAGPYSTNYPGGLFRPVSATLQIYPEGPALSQGGAGMMFYCSDAMQITAANGVNFTQNYLDNLQIARNWDGTQPVILHWTPNDNEASVSFNPALAGAAAAYSGIGAYIKGLAAGAAFRIEYEIGFEYTPNATVTLIVEKETSNIHPDTSYWISRVAQKHWSPLMLAPVSEYMAELQYLQNAGLGGYKTSMGLNAIGQVGINNTDNVNGGDNSDRAFEDGDVNADAVAPEAFDYNALKVDTGSNSLTTLNNRAQTIRETVMDNAGSLLGLANKFDPASAVITTLVNKLSPAVLTAVMTGVSRHIDGVKRSRAVSFNEQVNGLPC